MFRGIVFITCALTVSAETWLSSKSGTAMLQIEKAREGLLELRRSLDEERYQLAQERRAAGDEKLAAVRMAESARLLMQKAGGTEPRERKENVPSDRPSPASRKKKRYAGLVKNLVGGRSTLDDVLAARSGASSGDPWLKEREQGRAYLQSQAEFLARAEAHAHSRSFARFGLSRDCNLQVPTRARGETAGPRKGYEGSGPGNWEPGHPEWTSRWEVGGVRIGARSRSEQGGSDGEVIKRSVVEISQFADRVSCERGVHFGESEKEPRAFADKGGDLVGGEATEVWMDSESAERSNVSVTGE